VPLSELDLLQGRGVGRGSCVTLSGQGLQNLQQFGTVGGAVEQGSSKVKGHGKFVLGFAGRLSGRTRSHGIRSAGELRQTAGSDVSGRSTGPVEVYHTLCLCQGAEPLGAPFAGVVGGLVTDFDSHGVGCV